MTEQMEMEIVVLKSVLANGKDQHQFKAGLAQAIKLLEEAEQRIAKGATWIPVGERLPTLYETVLLINVDKDRSTGFLGDHGWTWDAADKVGRQCVPTDLMPLPGGPK